MPDDFEHSLDRLTKKEYRTAEDLGFGLTRQGQATIGRKYYPQLAKIIEEQRTSGRPKPVWRLSKRISVDALALRLITACRSATALARSSAGGSRSTVACCPS